MANNRPNRTSQSKSSLMAAAFQDHLIRSMALTDCLGPKKVPLGKAAQRLSKKEIKPVVDTGRGSRKLSQKKLNQDIEFVIDTKPPAPTLAQKMGLVEAPRQLMTEGEWKHAKTRSNDREDSNLPCVICKEDFGLQQQVLLSCTHVFHRACLEAFERFTGKKTCPMCRKEHYQTRVIHEGAKLHRDKSATRIQATWRGHVVRSWYKQLRQTIPPKDAVLREKFFKKKLESITDRMVKSYENNINAFLTEIDQSLEASRKVFSNFDTLFQQFSEEDWDKIQLKAIEREERECPICLSSLYNSSTEDKMSKLSLRESCGSKDIQNLSSSGSCRQAVLLSCSHVFHVTCLETFEELVISDRRHTCPVCRSAYQKHPL